MVSFNVFFHIILILLQIIYLNCEFNFDADNFKENLKLIEDTLSQCFIANDFVCHFNNVFFHKILPSFIQLTFLKLA